MPQVISNKVYENIQPYTVPETSTGKIIYANAFSGQSKTDMPQELKDLINSDVGLNGTNILIQLREKFKFFRNGPWYVDSRDGMIYIHNRKFFEEPVHTYTYQNENGEVLKVQFTTNYVTKQTKVTLHESIDPETKSIDIQQSLIEEADNKKEEKIIIPTVADNVVHIYSGQNGEHLSAQHDPTKSTLEDIYQDNLKAAVGEASKSDEWKAHSELEQDKMALVQGGDPVAMKDKYMDKTLSQYQTGELRSEMMGNLQKVMPDHKLRELDAVIKEMEKNPDGYEENLKKVLDGVYYTVEDATYPDIIEVDPKDYAGSTIGDRDPTVSMWNARKKGLENMRKDPSIHVIDDGITWGSGTMYSGVMEYDLSKYPEKVKIVKVVKQGKLKIPLYKLYHNLYSRYGGINKYAHAAAANANGGLKSREKVLNCIMTVVGRPMLESSMIINLQNVGRRWSGLWYIKKCTHRMDAGTGYLCDLELVKNNSRVGTSTNNIRLGTEGVVSQMAKKNGITSTGKDKKPVLDINELMKSFTKTEILYWGMKYILPYMDEETGEVDWAKVDRKGFGNAISTAMAYREYKEGDPIAQAGGSVKVEGINVSSDGELSWKKVKIEPVPQELIDKYEENFNPSRLMALLKEQYTKLKRSGLKLKINNTQLPYNRQ